MKVLAIDTCFGGCSAAIGDLDGAEGAIVHAARSERRDTGHAEALLPMIEQVTADATRYLQGGFDLSMIGRILVTHGPGSFTGTRIGVAAARAFSLALGVPATGVNSLALMALAAQRALGVDSVVVAMPGGKGDLIVQRFDGAIDLGAMPQLLPPEDAARAVDCTNAVLVGTGAATLAAAATALGRRPSSVEPDWQPDAAHLPMLVAGRSLDWSPPRPLYLRPPDAKPPVDPSVARI